MKHHELLRTRWAELKVEELIAPAFVAEFVYRSPQVTDRGLQHEVADLLIARGDAALLVSQKCQEDPGSRSSEKSRAWASKSASKAVDQLKGALWRVGRGVSVNDFLNLNRELRTIPEFVKYLDSRRRLPETELRSIGAEREIYAYYLLSNGSFDGFEDGNAARKLLTLRSAELQDTITMKADRDRHAALLEHVADQLAKRDLHFADGLSTEVLAKYEPLSTRRGYLEMQGIFAEMQLAERAELGLFFGKLIAQRRSRGKGLVLAAATVDSRPDLVMVFGSFEETKEFTRDKLLAMFHAICNGAMAHHERTRCLLIVDRNGRSGAYAVEQAAGIRFA